MKTEYLATNSGLSAVIWQPEQEVKAVLQITHGMTEHMGRYETLAEDLCNQGIAVAGFDLRGHGKNPGNPEIASFGKGGWDAAIKDMYLFFGELQNRFPEIPHYMMGFSLGSFLLREYLGKYPEGVAGAIIAGTGHQPGWLLAIMMAIVRGEFKKSGFDGTTDLVKQLSFGTYNQKFKPNRTEKDWLCQDPETVDDFLADPLCRENFSAGLFYQMLCAMKRTGSKEAYANWNKQKPILLICGENDPVGNMGKGAKAVEQAMKKAELNVTMHLLPGSRHMVLGEKESGAANAAEKLILQWIKR